MPLRDGVKETIQACKGAGINTRVISGDIPQTTVSITKESGVLDEDWTHSFDNKIFVHGDVLARLLQVMKEDVGKDTKEEIVRDTKVLARTTPS